MVFRGALHPMTFLSHACRNCGANLDVQPDNLLTICPYCGDAHPARDISDIPVHIVPSRSKDEVIAAASAHGRRQGHARSPVRGEERRGGLRAAVHQLRAGERRLAGLRSEDPQQENRQGAHRRRRLAAPRRSDTSSVEQRHVGGALLARAREAVSCAPTLPACRETYGFQQ